MLLDVNACTGRLNKLLVTVMAQYLDTVPS